MDRRLFLTTAGLLVVAGCGGGGEVASTEITRAPTPPDPNEVQYADFVFDGVKLTDKHGVEITPERMQEITRAHLVRLYFYVWDSKWGWHWRYMAYDTGHPYYDSNFSYKPHINFGVYFRWTDLQSDINEKTNKRTEYDGHFFVYRQQGTIICFRYDVSKDTKGSTGTKYDFCYGMPNATALAVATLVLSIVGVTALLAPPLVPVVVMLGV